MRLTLHIGSQELLQSRGSLCLKNKNNLFVFNFLAG
jgi:hypothetical protein